MHQEIGILGQGSYAGGRLGVSGVDHHLILRLQTEGQRGQAVQGLLGEDVKVLQAE